MTGAPADQARATILFLKSSRENGFFDIPEGQILELIVNSTLAVFRNDA